MIETLFAMAAILVPIFSDPASVPPSGGIACDIGPNFTGSIPAGAQAAGYTHCAANYDFTSSQFANLSTWLDCAGASSPLWYNLGYNTPATPCSRYNIVFDAVAGSNVLHLTWQPGDASYSEATWMTDHPSSNYSTWGNAAYTDMTFRTTSQTLTALPPNRNILSYFSFKNGGTPGTPTGFIEWDVTEQYTTDGNGGGGCVEWTNNGNGIVYACNYGLGPIPPWSSVSSVDATQYNTVGQEASGDPAQNLMGKCAWYNNIKVYCNHFVLTDSTSLTARTGFGLGVGNLNVSPGTEAPSVNMDMYLKQVTWWVAPNCDYRNQQCYTGDHMP